MDLNELMSIFAISELLTIFAGVLLMLPWFRKLKYSFAKASEYKAGCGAVGPEK
jgi:hypothetical protein